MRAQQNIIVTALLVLAVLGLLMTAVTMFKEKTNTTVEATGEKWDDVINEIKNT